jgi:hypothetical protein
MSHEAAAAHHGPAEHHEKPHDAAAGEHKAAAHAEAGHETKPHAEASTPAGKSALRQEFDREYKAAKERLKKGGNGILMGPENNVEEVSAIKTPVYIIRDWVRATIGNVLRRGKEIIKPLGASVESTWNFFSKPITSPVQTLFHPVKWAANVPRILTSGVRGIKNLKKAPITAANELYEDGLHAPEKRVDFKVKKWGAVGEKVANINGKVASALGWPLRALDGTIKWATDWIDDADDYIAGVQGAAA